MQNLLTFFCQNISVYAIFNDQSFNDMLTNDNSLTNDIVNFEQLGPGRFWQLCKRGIGHISISSVCALWSLFPPSSVSHHFYKLFLFHNK